MRFLYIPCVLLVAAMVAGAAPSSNDIEKEVEALIMEYSKLEDAMDMASQFELIAEDRVWLGPAGRRTDNAMWKDVQQQGFDNFRKVFPGVQFHREVRDLHVRVIGADVAVASFTWYTNRIVPMDLVPEKRDLLGSAPPPLLMSLVWEKRGTSWKIVNTHFCPLGNQ